jgi:hypothetical protein
MSQHSSSISRGRITNESKKRKVDAHREPLEGLRVRVELDHELLAVGADAEDEVTAEVVVRAHARRAVHGVLLDQLVCAQVGVGQVAAMWFATDEGRERRLRRSSER